MARHAWKYPWSSAGYHCGLVDHDVLVQQDELLSGIDDWQAFLRTDPELRLMLEEKNRTGRPFGPDGFYSVVKKLTGCDTRPGRPGRPKKC
jgi:hypothetical protein